MSIPRIIIIQAQLLDAEKNGHLLQTKRNRLISPKIICINLGMKSQWLQLGTMFGETSLTCAQPLRVSNLQKKAICSDSNSLTDSIHSNRITINSAWWQILTNNWRESKSNNKRTKCKWWTTSLWLNKVARKINLHIPKRMCLNNNSNRMKMSLIW